MGLSEILVIHLTVVAMTACKWRDCCFYRSFEVVFFVVSKARNWLMSRKLYCHLNTRAAVCQFGFLNEGVATLRLPLDWGRTESLRPEVFLLFERFSAFLRV